MKELICVPEKDQNKRFVLAKKGNKNLLVIGLNPSTADEVNPDPTSRNISRIAANNGYDGWIIANLYPERSSTPTDLSPKEDQKLFWENIHLIKHILTADNFKISHVLLAWGDGVDTMDRYYLKQAAGYFYREFQGMDLNYFCISKTRRGNPCHPSPQSVNCHLGPIDNIQLQKFDYKRYVRTIKLKPETTIDGIKFD